MKTIKNEKILAHILMVILIIIWGFDFVPAKWGLEILQPMQLLFVKYGLGLLVMLIIKLAYRNKNIIRLKDLPKFIICAIFGEILYFYCEYSAMDYLPISLLTIMLAFVPVISVILERIIYKKKANSIIIIGIVFSIIGVALVIGTDLSVIFQGRGIGYLLAIGAVFCWNAYNFLTASLEQYDSVTLSCTQMICTIIIIAPIALHNMPPASEFNGLVIAGLLWIGIIDSGAGFLIMVYGLQKLGPTTSALYSNFLPVTTTVFGAIFLGESITILQALGGAVVIAAGFIVIKEKGRLEEELHGKLS